MSREEDREVEAHAVAGVEQICMLVKADEYRPSEPFCLALGRLNGICARVARHMPPEPDDGQEAKVARA